MKAKQDDLVMEWESHGNARGLIQAMDAYASIELWRGWTNAPDHEDSVYSCVKFVEERLNRYDEKEAEEEKTILKNLEAELNLKGGQHDNLRQVFKRYEHKYHEWSIMCQKEKIELSKKVALESLIDLFHGERCAMPGWCYRYPEEHTYVQFLGQCTSDDEDNDMEKEANLDQLEQIMEGVLALAERAFKIEAIQWKGIWESVEGDSETLQKEQYFLTISENEKYRLQFFYTRDCG